MDIQMEAKKSRQNKFATTNAIGLMIKLKILFRVGFFAVFLGLETCFHQKVLFPF
jgi:hypothetical protein